MGTRSNQKFESPPNPRGILALNTIVSLYKIQFCKMLYSAYL